MKKIIYIAVALLLCQLASAVVINEFAVDPQQDWDSSGVISSTDEWFELYNDGASAVDLTGWALWLEDTTNETEILSGTIAAGGYRVIENPSGQQNNIGRLILYDNSNVVIDSVTYGAWDDGNSADNAADGNADSINNECLARSPNGADSGIDADDFVKTKCTKGFSNDLDAGSSNNITIIATIANSMPVIEGVVIEDEDSGKNGIQIYPLPGQNKTVAITATVSDSDGYSDISSVTANVKGSDVTLDFDSGVDANTAAYTGNFEMYYYDEPGNYTVEITAGDSVDSDIAVERFEYLTMIGMQIDTDTIQFSDLILGDTSYIYGDSDISTAANPTVKNIGNTVIDAEVYGSDLFKGASVIPISNLQYRFGALSYNVLTTSPATNDINLNPAAALNLDLSLYTPIDTEKGSYTGSLVLTAVS